MRGPHAVLFGDSRNVVLRDVRIHDAANWSCRIITDSLNF
jgi:hypothetical protein